MDVAGIVGVLEAASVLNRVILNMGVDYQKFMAMQQAAHAAGVQLSAQQLAELAQDAYSAQQQAYAAVAAAKAAIESPSAPFAPPPPQQP